MKLTHNFSKNYRNFIKGTGAPFRFAASFCIIFLFILSLYFAAQDNAVAGIKTIISKEPDINSLLSQASDDITLGRVSQAEQKLKIVLEFDPGNIYANQMKNKFVKGVEDVEDEIKKTQQVINLQPNWKDAWVRLADLYEKAGKPQLAAEAREKARGLKTS